MSWLEEAQIEQFHEDGYICPLKILSKKEFIINGKKNDCREL